MLEPKTENKAVRAISTFAEFHQEIVSFFNRMHEP